MWTNNNLEHQEFCVILSWMKQWQILLRNSSIDTNTNDKYLGTLTSNGKF